MIKVLSEKDVRKTIIKWLSRQGYNRNLQESQTEEHGVDIKVRHYRYPRYYLVEVKGDADPQQVKHPGSRREVSFIQALGQIISRMEYKAKYKYALGFPSSYETKIMKRLPWRICNKLRLNVLLVDNNKKVKNVTWKDLKKYQKWKN